MEFFVIGIDGQGDMKHICGTIAAEGKARAGKAVKVPNFITFTPSTCHNYTLCSIRNNDI